MRDKEKEKEVFRKIEILFEEENGVDVFAACVSNVFEYIGELPYRKGTQVVIYLQSLIDNFKQTGWEHKYEEDDQG